MVVSSPTHGLIINQWVDDDTTISVFAMLTSSQRIKSIYNCLCEVFIDGITLFKLFDKIQHYHRICIPSGAEAQNMWRHCSFNVHLSFSLANHTNRQEDLTVHDDVIKWKHFPRYWPFVRGIHWSPVNSPHKGQWCRALMFSLKINDWINNHEAADSRCHRAHYDVTVMWIGYHVSSHWQSYSYEARTVTQSSDCVTV